MKNIDRTIGLSFLLIAGIFFINTFKLPEDTQGYPRFMLGIMTTLAILLIIKSFIKSEDQSWKDLFGYIQWKRFLYVFIFSLLYLVLINKVGFFITTVGYLLIMMIFLKGSRSLILISIPSFTLLLYLIFRVFLKVPLPTGIFI